jgi:ATP-binding cassette subfamily B multidrug efflux pump
MSDDRSPPPTRQAGPTSTGSRGSIGHGRGMGRGGPLPGFGMPGEKAKNFKGSLMRLLGYLKDSRATLLAVVAMAVLGTAFGIVSPKILGEATTKLFEGVMNALHGKAVGVDFAYIGRILALLAVLYVLSAAFTFAQQQVMVGIAQRMVYTLRREISEKLSRLPLKYYDDHSHGDVMSRVSNDVDTVSTTLQQALTQLLSSLIGILGALVMMLTISPLLTLIAVATIPLMILLTKAIAKRSGRYFVGQQKAIGDLNGHVEEMFSGHRIVKAYGGEAASIEAFEESNSKLYDAGWKAQFVSGLIMPLMSFVNNIGYVAICVVGALMAAARSITVGDIQAFLQYLRQFGMPIVQTANMANVIQSTIAGAERVFEILDEEEEEPSTDRGEPEARKRAGPIGKVEIEAMDFSYRKDAELIKGLNFFVDPGHVVAIVGPTGAGKTTLVNLLMRFYEIDAGAIRVDGRDIRSMSRFELRAMFGMVLQDAWLFNGSVRENIAFGREGATEEEIRAAAKAAYADHFIRTLPAGYDTVLNEEASNVSQGQKQLLTIARALLADPTILILDEATSSVDTRTELHIQNALATLMEGRTSFVIAHRLSTIRDADLILVMNSGSVVEKGNHGDLMALRGFYYDLYESQFASPEKLLEGA